MRFQTPIQFGDLLSEFAVGGEQFAQPYEDANHKDAHFDGTLRIEDRGSHDGAVFGEGVRQIAAASAAGS